MPVLHQILALALVVTIAGCSNQDVLNEPSDGLVFGGPSADQLFSKFQGEWQFSTREFDPELNPPPFTGGPDIRIVGHIIRFVANDGESELRLCQARKTDNGISCEGWFHEDISDPGDMQRVICSLRTTNEGIELRWRKLYDIGYSNDSVVAASDYVAPDYPASDKNPPWWVETYTKAAG